MNVIRKISRNFVIDFFSTDGSSSLAYIDELLKLITIPGEKSFLYVPHCVYLGE